MLQQTNLKRYSRVSYNGKDYEIQEISAITAKLKSLEAFEEPKNERVNLNAVPISMLEPSSEDIEKRMQAYKTQILPSLAAKKIRFAIIAGDAGLGKSFALESYSDFHILKTKITPLQLFMQLHDNRDSVIVLDDMPQEIYHQNTPVAEILKSATDDKHRVFWKSTSKLLDGYDTEFTFNGCILILTNLHLDKFDAALLDRSKATRSLKFTKVEKLRLIKQHLIPTAKTMQFNEKIAVELFQELINAVNNGRINSLSLRIIPKMFVEYEITQDVTQAIKNCRY